MIVNDLLTNLDCNLDVKFQQQASWVPPEIQKSIQKQIEFKLNEKQ